MKIIPFLLIILLLNGCGFHLRGMADPAGLQLHAIHLVPDSPYDQTQQGIRQQFIDQHIELNPTAPTLSIVSENFSKHILVYGSNGQIRQERIRYTLVFQLEDVNGQLLIPKTQVHAERDRLINQDQVLGDYNEEELLQKDMRRECVNEMIRYFSS